MMLAVNNVLKNYGNIKAIDIPYLQVKESESVGLVGNNGAGKTTFLRAVLDLIELNSGHFLIRNEHVNKSESWKDFTGSYLDENFLIGFLTPEEFFKFIWNIRKLPANDIDLFYKNFEDFFGNEILNKNKLIRDFSKGNQAKIGISAAMMFKPQFLVLDEPFAHLDPSSQILLKRKLKIINNENSTTQIISSHNLNHITDVCDRILIIDHGIIIREFTTDHNTLDEIENYFISKLNNGDE